MENKLVAGTSGRGDSSMAFLNKIVNPLVRLILRSPLHGLMSGTLLLITYRGRKTGREYSLPVQYVQTGQTIYIMPGLPERKTWWRNLKETSPVQLILRGQSLAGHATALKPASDSESIQEGLRLFLRCFPAMAKVHHIGMGANGNFIAADLQQAAKQAVIIRVELS
jgi:deazaflavin-dependent oxidoreductase (nitroreductase family)